MCTSRRCRHAPVTARCPRPTKLRRTALIMAQGKGPTTQLQLHSFDLRFISATVTRRIVPTHQPEDHRPTPLTDDMQQDAPTTKTERPLLVLGANHSGCVMSHPHAMRRPMLKRERKTRYLETLLETKFWGRGREETDTQIKTVLYSV